MYKNIPDNGMDEVEEGSGVERSTASVVLNAENLTVLWHQLRAAHCHSNILTTLAYAWAMLRLMWRGDPARPDFHSWMGSLADQKNKPAALRSLLR